MLYREIIAVCSEIHTKHINTLCGQHTEFLNVKVSLGCKGLNTIQSNNFSLSTSVSTASYHSTNTPYPPKS